MSGPSRKRSTSSERKAATIRDVARFSGVSTATVTRVLQGQPSVREDTRLRVQEAVRILGYRPDAIARALVTRSSKTVGMLLPSSGDSFWGGIATGIENRALQAGFGVLFANAHGDLSREAAVIELFLGNRVDGIIVAGSVSGPGDWFGGGNAPIPVILVDSHGRFSGDELREAQVAPPHQLLRSITMRTVAGPRVGHVFFDDIGGARLLVNDLVSKGHTRLAFVGGEPARPTLLRILGFRIALGEAGLEPVAIRPCEETLEAGRVTALSVLSSPDPPTAIVAYSDLVAISVLRAAHELRIRVPEDVSVAGFDDIELAAFVEPPLTTVAQPKEEMGRWAMDMVLTGLEGEMKPASRDVPGQLVVRSSTGPPDSGS
jgi:DNA-binding LacI/PurR family transcriptional regulator